MKEDEGSFQCTRLILRDHLTNELALAFPELKDSTGKGLVVLKSDAALSLGRKTPANAASFQFPGFSFDLG